MRLSPPSMKHQLSRALARGRGGATALVSSRTSFLGLSAFRTTSRTPPFLIAAAAASPPLLLHRCFSAAAPAPQPQHRPPMPPPLVAPSGAVPSPSSPPSPASATAATPSSAASTPPPPEDFVRTAIQRLLGQEAAEYAAEDALLKKAIRSFQVRFDFCVFLTSLEKLLELSFH